LGPVHAFNMCHAPKSTGPNDARKLKPSFHTVWDAT
jgi:hypothetical protein